MISRSGDGRNRTILSAFRSRTGRNQPRNTRYIFGPSVWLRNLIKPPPGYGVAYMDWASRNSESPRLSPATQPCWPPTSRETPISPSPSRPAQSRLTPPKRHHRERELFKQCALAVPYGMEAKARSQDRSAAGRRPGSHPGPSEVKRHFWAWSDAAVDQAMLVGRYPHVRLAGARRPNFNPRSLRNFLAANGAEMLRLAACWDRTRDRGLRPGP